MRILVTLRYSLVQFSSAVQSSAFTAPHTAARQASLSIINSGSPPKPMSIDLLMPFNHLILCHLLLFLPSIFPSIRVFSNESTLHMRWPGKPSKMQYRECNKWLTACSWTRALEFDRNTSDLRLFVLPPKNKINNKKPLIKQLF